MPKKRIGGTLEIVGRMMAIGPANDLLGRAQIACNIPGGDAELQQPGGAGVSQDVGCDLVSEMGEITSSIESATQFEDRLAGVFNGARDSSFLRAQEMAEQARWNGNGRATLAGFPLTIASAVYQLADEIDPAAS